MYYGYCYGYYVTMMVLETSHTQIITQSLMSPAAVNQCILQNP